LSSEFELAPCDAGFTVRERRGGQVMHSRVGAWEEARRIYVGQSGLRPRSRPWVVHDVGMGIAANAIAAMELTPAGCGLEVHSFETRPEGLAFALACREEFPFLDRWRGAAEAVLREGEWRSPDGRCSWRLWRGDFRLATAAPRADLVFFDLYAPSACPGDWGVGAFQALLARAPPDSLLITYSASTAVRNALLLAGFHVGSGTGTSAKRESTLASPSRARLGRALGLEWLEKTGRSRTPWPADWDGGAEGARERIRSRLS
jgi:tRNA U34 5-methylaminomethyl-2-thiouridine-forming methyltransferase MnmC